MSSPALRPAVFFDRAGTLLVELPVPLADPARIELLPGAAEVLADVRAAGFLCVLVTNQSAIARGLLDLERLARVHDALRERLAAEGARFDLVLHCPHHPSEGFPPYRRACPCRKPEPGLVLEAARRLPIDLARSWMVGDALRDLECGARAGVRGLLVATGIGAREWSAGARERLSADSFVPDRAAARDAILGARAQSL